jgi:hypothetical protein
MRIPAGAMFVLIGALGLHTRGEEAKEPPPAAPRADPEARKQRDEAVQKIIEDFKNELREAKTPEARETAVSKLGKNEPDPRILTELARFLADAECVRMAAMTAIADYRGDSRAAQALANALPQNAKKPILLCRNLEALGRVGRDFTVPILAKHLPHANTAVAASAIKGLGDVGTASALEQILAAWEDLDAKKMKGGGLKKYAEDRLKVMGPAFTHAMKWLTDQQFFFVQQYREWWGQNKATYKPKEKASTRDLFGLTANPAGGNPSAAGPDSGTGPITLAKPEGAFFRAVNLNGPALTIDGNAWEAGNEAQDVKVSGAAFENKGGRLTPDVSRELERAKMLRSGFKGSGSLTVTLAGLPPGSYHVYAYLWSNPGPEMYAVKVQGILTSANCFTGLAGRWDRVGPWLAKTSDGELTIAFTGSVNLCGIELWRP